MKQKILFICLCFVFVTYSYAQQTLSLKEVVQLVLDNNYDIRIKDFDKQIAANENTLANAGGMPRVRLLSDLRYGLQGIQDPTSVATGILHSVGITPKIQTDWILFGSKRVRNAKTALETKENGSNLEYQLTVESSLIAAITLYYQGLLLLDKQKIIKSLLERSKKDWQSSKLQFEQGNISGYDYNQKESALWSDSSNYLTTIIQIDQLYTQLKKVCAIEDTIPIAIQGQLPNEFPVYNYQNLKSTVTQNNYRLRLESSYLHLKQLDTEIKRANRKPLIALSNQFFTDFQYIESKFTDVNFATNIRFFIGLSMSWTLWDAGKTKGIIRSAELNYEQESLNKEKMEHDIFNELHKTYKAYGWRKQMLDVKEKSLEAVKYNFELLDKRYKKGLTNGFEYFQAKKSYEKAYSEVLVARNQVMMQELELIRMSGGILDFVN